MPDFAQLGGNSSFLTALTQQLYEDFEDVVTFRGEDDIRLWLRGLDTSDETNRRVFTMCIKNPAWVRLLALRVEKFRAQE
jgi:hypothetical protein